MTASIDTSQDLIDALNEIHSHKNSYHKARLYAEGKAHEVIALATHEYWAPKIGATVGKFRLNVAGLVISSRTDRMEIAGRQVFIGPDENKNLEQVLNQSIWEHNQLDIEIPDFIYRTVMYGDAYLIVWPTPPTITNPNPQTVDIFLHGPESMRVFYDIDNPRTITYAAKTWADKDNFQRVDLYYPDRLERYISLNPIDKNGTEYDVRNFRLFDDDGQDAIAENPYGQVPVFHARTKTPYGKPEHENAYGPQNAITKLVASHMANVDDHALPIRAALSRPNTTGADLTDWNDVNNATSSDPIDALRLENGELPTVRMNRGHITKLHDTDSLVQLGGAPAETFLAPISAYIRYLAAITRTPLNQLDPSGQIESGESRRARDASLTKRVNRLCTIIGAAIEDALEFALSILEPNSANIKVKITWKPAEQIDTLEEWQAVKAQQEAGVPQRDSLLEAGYLPAQVDAWDESPDIIQKLAEAERIAALAQTLGSAVQLGAITVEQAQSLISNIVGSDTNDQ